MKLGPAMLHWVIQIWFDDLLKVLPCLLQGEYYNADEVQAMVAAEMLEEKRKKAEEEDMFDDIGAEAGQVMVVAMMMLFIKMTFRRRRCSLCSIALTLC